MHFLLDQKSDDLFITVNVIFRPNCNCRLFSVHACDHVMSHSNCIDYVPVAQVYQCHNGLVDWSPRCTARVGVRIVLWAIIFFISFHCLPVPMGYGFRVRVSDSVYCVISYLFG